MGVDRTSSERGRRYRNRVKLEDSTRGNSAISPEKYKKDIPVQAWMESRYLATLSEWLDKDQDVYSRTRTLSEVLQEGVRLLVEHLVRRGEVDMVDDPLAAQNMLVMKYRISIRKGYGARGKNNSIHNQVLTERRREIAGSVENIEPLRDIRERPVNEVNLGRMRIPEKDRELIEEQVRIYKELEQRDLDKEVEKQKAAAMDSPHFRKEPERELTADEVAEINTKRNLEKMAAADKALEDF